MSLQLGLIILPSNTEELNKVLLALSTAGLSDLVAGAPVTNGKAASPAAKATPKEVKAQEEKLAAVTADQVKTAMTRVRDELGEDTLTELLTAYGAVKLKDVAKDDWASLVAAANTALDGVNDDDLGGADDSLDDDDGFGLDDDDGADDAPDAETVKITVQAYARKHGKEKATALLSKYGLNTVRGLATADAGTLTKIQAAAAKL